MGHYFLTPLYRELVESGMLLYVAMQSRPDNIFWLHDSFSEVKGQFFLDSIILLIFFEKMKILYNCL